MCITGCGGTKKKGVQPIKNPIVKKTIVVTSLPINKIKVNTEAIKFERNI